MKDIQKRVKQFVKENNLKSKPEFRTLDIVSELGEVAKEILKSSNYGQMTPKLTEEMQEELGDLLFSLVCLANHYDVDLEKALQSALEKYKKRIKKGSAGSEVE